MEPFLLTPGPLTTSLTTKQAMLRDWGSRDAEFIRLNARVRERLVELAGGRGTHVCVPLQGSGTFIVEAMLATMVPPDGKVLLLVNGAYGKRMIRMCEYHRRAHTAIEVPEDQPVDPGAADGALVADPAITHVAVVHCETTSGVLNPVAKVAEVVARRGRRLLIDSMSAFGAIPLDAARIPFDAMVSSANKCLEGVPGMGFVFADKHALAAAEGNCHSLAMDLFDQHRYMAKTGQWRFTPPTHVVAALHEALLQYAEEGGLPARHRRYARNCQALLDGMAELGLRSFLPAAIQAPIIVTFHAPQDPRYHFKDFYEGVKAKGFILYPGKLTQVETFRVGCIGDVDATQMHAAVAAIAEVLQALHINLPSSGSHP